MRMHAPLAVVTAALSFGLTACAAASPPVPTVAPLPNRPHVLPMQGLDPCSVFTADQLRQVGVAPEQQDLAPPAPDNGNAPTCVWIQGRPTDLVTNVYVQGVTYLGFDDVRARTPDSTVVDIQGFRAVQYNDSTPKQPSCQVYVDVADGQTLEVAYGFYTGRDPALACPTATKLANTAISNLLSR